MTPEILTSIRELDSRFTDGIRVTLLWCEHDGRVMVSVLDTKSRDAFCLDVCQGECPLDVFHHPYAYAAHRGILTVPRANHSEPDWAIAA